MNSDKARLVGLLPDVFRRSLEPGSVFDTFLDNMLAMLQPAEARMDAFDELLDPMRAPEQFVRFLACWVDLDRLWQDAGPGDSASVLMDTPRLRYLVASASELSQWRGTARGLKRFLELATGSTGFVIEEGRDSNGMDRPFHICITVPAEAGIRLRLVERIIEQEKPAYATCELIVEK